MKVANTPENEQERLKALNGLSILDTLPESDYDNVTKLASHICETPISLVSLVDSNRQWFKSKVGLNVSETPREYAFCTHAMEKPQEILIVNDSRSDERFHDNPLVTGDPHVIFYAGVPLVASGGFALGTLCVIDSKPNELNESQKEALKTLANSVVRLFDLRSNEIELERKRQDLEERNKELEKFASLAAHDLRSPLNNMSTTIGLLQQKLADTTDSQVGELLGYLNESADTLRILIDGILEQNRSMDLLGHEEEIIELSRFFKSLVDLLDKQGSYNIIYPTIPRSISINKPVISRILMNLLNNAIEHNEKKGLKISLEYAEDNKHHIFRVQDNGRGIDPKYHERVFNLFERIQFNKRSQQRGQGIGLSTVKKLVKGLGGELRMRSDIDAGTTFDVLLPK